MVLHYGGPVTFGWHEEGGSLLDKETNRLADAIVGDNALYLPPRGRASVGIAQLSSFDEEDFRIDITKASLGLDVLRDLGTDLLPDVGDKAIADVAKSCGGTLTEVEKPESIKDLGALRDDGLSSLGCITSGFTEAARDGLLDGVKVTRLGQVANSLKKASVVGKLLDLYGSEWDLADLFTSEVLVKPNPSFGWGFSVFARTLKVAPAQPVMPAELASAPVPALCTHPAGNLVNGSLPGIPSNDGVVQLADEAFTSSPGYLLTDLNGDGVTDAAAVIYCNLGGVSWPESIQFYTHQAGSPGLKRLGGISLETVSIPAGANPDSRDYVETMKAAGGGIDVTWGAVAMGRCEACGGFTVSAHLAFNGTGVVASDVTHRSLDDIVWTLSLDGLGPVKLGMTVAQAAEAIGVGGTVGSGYGGAECTSEDFAIGGPLTGPESQQQSLVRALLDPSGHVRAVEFYGLNARTPSGIAVGDPESALTGAYPSNLTSQPLYDGPGTQYVYTPTDPSLADRRLVFNVIDGKVASMNVAKTDIPLNSCDD